MVADLRRLIANYEYDCRRYATLDERTRQFIEDLNGFVDQIEDYGTQRYWSGHHAGETVGQDDGWSEGYEMGLADGRWEGVDSDE